MKKKIMIKRVGGKLETLIFDTTEKNELETLQEIVGGYIEIITEINGFTIIGNEEGKLMGLQPNLTSSVIGTLVGDLVFAKYKNGVLVSLNEEDMRNVSKWVEMCQGYENSQAIEETINAVIDNIQVAYDNLGDSLEELYKLSKSKGVEQETIKYLNNQINKSYKILDNILQEIMFAQE